MRKCKEDGLSLVFDRRKAYIKHFSYTGLHHMLTAVDSTGKGRRKHYNPWTGTPTFMSSSQSQPYKDKDNEAISYYTCQCN